MIEPIVGKKYKTINCKPVAVEFRNRDFVVIKITREFVKIVFLDNPGWNNGWNNGPKGWSAIRREYFHARCTPLDFEPYRNINTMKFI